MDSLLDTIDVQKTREILSEISGEFDESSEEAAVLVMAWFALFHGWHSGKFGDYKNDSIDSTEAEPS